MLQIIVMPVIEITYYLVLSVALPLISACVAVIVTICNADDTALGDLRAIRIPWWCEVSCGVAGLIAIWGLGQSIFWYIGVSQVTMLLLRLFETRLHRIDLTVQERMQAMLLRMQ